MTIFIRLFNLLWSKKVKLLFLLALVIGIVAVSLYFKDQNTNKFKHKEVITSDSSPQDVERILKRNVTGLVDKKDYQTFQDINISIATQYINTKDYANAKRILLETIQQVPQDKITSDTYASIAMLLKEQNDVAGFKEYGAKTIEKLRFEKKYKEAESWESALK